MRKNLITEDDLKEIVELSGTVPEEYRQKCFELLLSHTLHSLSKSSGRIVKSEMELDEEKKPQVSEPSEQFILPIDVKAFMAQYGLDENTLWDFFLAGEGEIRPVYKLSTAVKSEAQLQHALMMCLENAISSGAFEVNIEALRLRCQEQKCYDSANFKAHIKRKSDWFKEIDDVEDLVLSPMGKSELADLLDELSTEHE